MLLHLANGDGGGFRAQNLPCSGNGDAALAPKPAVCGALRGSDGTFLCSEVWLAVRSDEFEPVSVFADEHVPGGDRVASSTGLNVDKAAAILSEPFERFTRRKAFIFCTKTLHGGEHRFGPDHIPIEHGPAFV